MDDNEQNKPISPDKIIIERTKRPLFNQFLFGMGIGTVFSVLDSLRIAIAKNKKISFSDNAIANTLSSVLLSAPMWGAFSVLWELGARAFSKPEIIHLPTPPAPPAPPASSTPPASALAQVPQILDILVAEKQLTPEQQTHVLTEIKNGRKGFAAEIAVANNFVTKEQVDEALGRQGMMKAEAAVSDIQAIKDHGALALPSYLQANWGNNGVNPAIVNPTRADGISAAANNAQNLVIAANKNPLLAPVLFDGVIAAASLANGIALGNSPVTPLAKLHKSWMHTMDHALTTAAHAHPDAVTDKQGNRLEVRDFIAARDAEVHAAVEQALQAPPREPGQSR